MLDTVVVQKFCWEGEVETFLLLAFKVEDSDWGVVSTLEFDHFKSN